MDLTAVVILIPEKTGEFFILPHFFIPRERAYENEKEDKFYILFEKNKDTQPLHSDMLWIEMEIIDYIVVRE